METGSSSSTTNPQPSILPPNSELNTANSTSNQDDQVLPQYNLNQIRKHARGQIAQRIKRSQGEETKDKDGETSGEECEYYIAYTISIY